MRQNKIPALMELYIIIHETTNKQITFTGSNYMKCYEGNTWVVLYWGDTLLGRG